MLRSGWVQTLAVLIGIVAAAALVIPALTDELATPTVTPALNLESHLIAFVEGIRPAGEYRDPTSQEQNLAATGMDLLLDKEDSLTEAAGLFARLGFTMATGQDQATGRRYAMLTQEPASPRAWGLVLVDLSAPATWAVEVPHPNSDLHTERLGLGLFRRTPGAVMIVAGAHRRAAGEAADVAHNANTLFHAMASRFARRDLPQMQLHGFAKRSLPGADVVASGGSAPTTPMLRRIANSLRDAGFQTCRAWATRCGRLEGTLNVQSEEAGRRGSVFVHLEVSWTVRADEARSTALVIALAASQTVGA